MNQPTSKLTTINSGKTKGLGNDFAIRMAFILPLALAGYIEPGVSSSSLLPNGSDVSGNQVKRVVLLVILIVVLAIQVGASDQVVGESKLASQCIDCQQGS